MKPLVVEANANITYELSTIEVIVGNNAKSTLAITILNNLSGDSRTQR